MTARLAPEVLAAGERAGMEQAAQAAWQSMSPEVREVMASQAPPHAGPWLPYPEEGAWVRRDSQDRIVAELYEGEHQWQYRHYTTGGNPGTSFDGGQDIESLKRMVDTQLRTAGWELG